MENSRRNFFRKGLAGAIALSSLTGCVDTSNVEKKRCKAKRVVLISLDGICVEGFQQAQTPNLDALLAEGALSIQTRVVMPSITLPNWTSHLTGSGPEQHGVVDNGWQISFRIHNAKDVIETSLKFDIQIIGMPVDVNIKFNCQW